MLGIWKGTRNSLSVHSFFYAVLLVCSFALWPQASTAQAPIKIGFGMALTGGLAGGGKMTLLAYQIWKDEINSKGGLLGRPVELVYYDDQSNPSIVPNLYAKLLDVDKVDLVISPYATNQIAPAMPIVMQKGMAFMSLFGVGVNDDFKYNKYFQIVPNGADTKVAPSLGFLETTRLLDPKPQTIAIVGTDAEYAHNVLLGARQTISRLGLEDCI